jgi:TfoX/Sxy family transcriptional regulator of competence genes
MATSVKTVQYICDQAGLRQRLSYRKMFGEFALYLDEKTVAFVCDDQLFLKPTPEGRAFLGEVTEAPPYPGAKQYFLISSELDDPERLGELLQVTAKSLPLPKPRSRPKSKTNLRRKPAR